MIDLVFNQIERLSRPVLAALTYLLVVMIGLFDFATGTEVSISVFYILPVSIAAWFLSKWEGLGVSLASAIVWFSADLFASTSYSHPVVPYWNALVMFGFFAVGSLVISALHASIERENMIARDIQGDLMPKEMPKMPGVEFAATWHPASTVGGDCYDVIRINETCVAFCIADAAGHGVTAALLISNFQATLRFLSREFTSPKILCKRINEFMFRNFGPSNLITFFYAVLDISTKRIVYTNAGQTIPILVHCDGTLCELSDGGIPLGVMPDFSYDEGMITMVPGDFLAMTTDGVVELTNIKDEMFGQERLIELLVRQRGRGAAAVRDSIMNAVGEFGLSKIVDDLTILVLSMDHSSD